MKQRSTHTLMSAATAAALALSIANFAGAQTAGSAGSGSASPGGAANQSGSSTAPATSTRVGERTEQADPSVSGGRKSTAPDSGTASANRNPSASSQNGTASGTASTPSTDPLSPTGRTSTHMPTDANPAATTAAAAVRTAFDADPAFARSGVQILPEGERLVLRGVVADNKARKALEKAAKAAAGDVKIDNQLTLKSDSR